jgi:hypothetical protein
MLEHFSVLRIHTQYVYFHWCGLHEKHQISFGILIQTKNIPQDAVKPLAIHVVDRTVQCFSTGEGSVAWWYGEVVSKLPFKCVNHIIKAIWHVFKWKEKYLCSTYKGQLETNKLYSYVINTFSRRRYVLTFHPWSSDAGKGRLNTSCSGVANLSPVIRVGSERRRPLFRATGDNIQYDSPILQWTNVCRKVRLHGITAALSLEGSGALGPVWPCLGRNPSRLFLRPLTSLSELPHSLKTACYFARSKEKTRQTWPCSFKHANSRKHTCCQTNGAVRLTHRHCVTQAVHVMVFIFLLCWTPPVAVHLSTRQF